MYKWIFSTTLIILSFFVVQKTTQASNFSFSSANGYVYACPVFPTQKTCFHNGNENSDVVIHTGSNQLELIATSTFPSLLVPSTTQITTLGFLVKEFSPQSTTLEGGVTCVDGSGSHSDSKQINIPSDDNFQAANFRFDTPIPCNFDTLSYLRMTVAVVSGSDIGIAGTDSNLSSHFYLTNATLTSNYSSYAYIFTLNKSIVTTTQATDTTIDGIVVQECDNTDFTIFSVDYGQGLCEVAQFLFIPDQNVLNLFSDLKTDLNNKPPFGYFTSITSTTSTSSLSSLATTTPTTTLPSNLSLLNTISTPVDYALALLFGSSFLFFIFHRFRKFDL